MRQQHVQGARHDRTSLRPTCRLRGRRRVLLERNQHMRQEPSTWRCVRSFRPSLLRRRCFLWRHHAMRGPADEAGRRMHLVLAVSGLACLPQQHVRGTLAARCRLRLRRAMRDRPSVRVFRAKVRAKTRGRCVLRTDRLVYWRMRFQRQQVHLRLLINRLRCRPSMGRRFHRQVQDE